MELTKQEFANKLKEAVKQKYIFPHQAQQARKKFKKNGNTEILQTIEIQKEAKIKAKNLINTKWHDLTEIESLQTIVRQNSTLISLQKDIKGWVTFLGIVTLIGVIGAIIVAFQ